MVSATAHGMQERGFALLSPEGSMRIVGPGTGSSFRRGRTADFP
jgi:hypothetical protein